MLADLFGRFIKRSYFKPLKFVNKLTPLEPDRLPSIPTYRVLDNDGKLIASSEEPMVLLWYSNIIQVVGVVERR
jgi:hypothetical protein